APDAHCAGPGLITRWSRSERSAGDLHDAATELLPGHRLEQRLVLAAHDGALALRRVADGDGVRGHPSDEHDRVADDRGRTDVVAVEREREIACGDLGGDVLVPVAIRVGQVREQRARLLAEDATQIGNEADPPLRSVVPLAPAQY